MGYHEGNAGQIAEWIGAAAGFEVAAFFEEGDAPPVIDAATENKKRVSQRMEYPTQDSYKGLPLIISRDWPERLRAMGITKVLPVSSDNRQRQAGIKRCLENGFELVSAIHPTAIILEHVLIEPGVWIHAGSIVGYKAEIKTGVMLNTGVKVDHHCVLQSCSQMDPGVVTASHVTLNPLAHVHTGAVIINRITIGEAAIVGAGAVVIRDVPARSTVVGVPARVIKQR